MGKPRPEIRMDIDFAKPSKALLRHIDGALLREANDILDEATPRAPIDTGALRASRYAKADYRQPNAVVFGYTAPYAAAVHERTEVYHATGEAKWLIKVINKRSAQTAGNIARHARGIARGVWAATRGRS